MTIITNENRTGDLNFFDSLPSEIIINHIFSNLNVVEALKTLTTSEKWHQQMNDHLVKVISHETVTWARKTFFMCFYEKDPANRIRFEIARNSPMPLHPDYGDNLLGRAIRKLNVKAVTEFLRLGMDPNGENFDSTNTFWSGLVLLQVTTDIEFEKFKEIVKACLKAGLNFNNSDIIYSLITWGKPSGKTYDLFAFCIEQGLNINFQNSKTGRTVMHGILDFPYDENAPWIEYLLTLGADPTIQNQWEESSLDIAKKKNVTEMLKVFQKYGYS